MDPRTPSTPGSPSTPNSTPRTLRPPEAADRMEAFHRVSELLQCKWSIAVLDALARGTQRPSQIRDALPGLSDKVLADRLRKLERYGLITRRAFAEVPPRVEYTLTPRGHELAGLVERIRDFADQWGRVPGAPGNPPD